MSLADLFLDTHPFNAHTTALETLAAGVPLLTLRGRTFASRVATSLLHSVQLGHLSVESSTDYVRLAVELGRAPEQLEQLRTHLRQLRGSAPVFDPGRLCRHMEAALEWIWQRHLRGERPAALSVEPL